MPVPGLGLRFLACVCRVPSGAQSLQPGPAEMPPGPQEGVPSGEQAGATPPVGLFLPETKSSFVQSSASLPQLRGKRAALCLIGNWGPHASLGHRPLPALTWITETRTLGESRVSHVLSDPAQWLLLLPFFGGKRGVGAGGGHVGCSLSSSSLLRVTS